MPRKVRDANLETRTARHRLAVRHKPYFRLIERGLHLGYRRLNGRPGTWLARRYVSDGRYVTENLRTANGTLVLADDYADSDGDRILNFAQAQQAARGPRAQQSSGAAFRPRYSSSRGGIHPPALREHQAQHAYHRPPAPLAR